MFHQSEKKRREENEEVIAEFERQRDNAVEEREKAGTHFFGVAVPNIPPDAVIPALSLARRDAHFVSRRPEQVLPVLSAEEKLAAAADAQSAAPSEHREELSAQPAGASSDDGSDSLVADGEVEALAETTPGQDENAIGDAAEEGGDGAAGASGLNLLPRDPNPGHGSFNDNGGDIVSTMAGESDCEEEGNSPGRRKSAADDLKHPITGLNKSILGRMWSTPNLLTANAGGNVAASSAGANNGENRRPSASDAEPEDDQAVSTTKFTDKNFWPNNVVSTQESKRGLGSGGILPEAELWDPFCRDVFPGSLCSLALK